MSIRGPKRVGLWLTGLCLAILGESQATWSIIVVDTRTGEVAVAGATCVAGLDLKQEIATIHVGVGGGIAQAATNQQGRQRIGREIPRGTDPDQILFMITDQDAAASNRQYGIVDRQGRSESFTGDGTAFWAGHINGRAGDLVYAIQGNVLAGPLVVENAERALIETSGTMADKVMAAMTAAAHSGGDLRCSRNLPKSSHTAFMVVSRFGDDEGFCPNGICDNGQYYLDLNVIGDRSGRDPDPILILGNRFAQWRREKVGLTDQVRSQVSVSPLRLPADGSSEACLTIRLIDLDGTPLRHGGTVLSVSHHESSDGVSHIGEVESLGGGVYRCPILASETMGKDVFQIDFIDPAMDIFASSAPLSVLPELEFRSPLRLYGQVSRLDASLGTDLEMKLDAPSSWQLSPYVVLVSTSGSEPGIDLGSLRLPLNLDPFLVHSWDQRNRSPFVNTEGFLDRDGDARASFEPIPGMLDPFVGQSLTFAWLTLARGGAASTTLEVTIIP